MIILHEEIRDLYAISDMLLPIILLYFRLCELRKTDDFLYV